MHGHQYCTEDLAQQAATQFSLAAQLCDSCRTYHAIWPYRRLARVVASADAGSSEFATAFDTLFKAACRRVLIAGAADAGLLALTARLGASYDVDIVVLDRCRTPLETCRQFARRWSLRVQTLHQDLTTLDISEEFDIVFANSVLLFIAPEQRVEALRGMARALRPHGRLVNVFDARRAGEVATCSRRDYSGWMVAELERRGVVLPEPEGSFLMRLDDYARELDRRVAAFNRLEEVVALHEQAGFAINRCVETDMGITSSWRDFAAKLAKRRYLIEAEPVRSKDSN